MIEDPIIYRDNPDDRVLDLRPDGVSCIPVLGMSSFLSVRPGPDYHIHPGCMEFCLCLKGNLIFDSRGQEYPFMPGRVFVSSPREPHHLRHNPSGLKTYRILFAIPAEGQPVLGLDRRESEWLTRSLTHLPKRLFAATPRIRAAFEQLFRLYDNERRGSPARRVRLKTAALELLVALVDAARLQPRKAPDAISRIARRIREHPNAEYPAEAMAHETGLSLSAFSDAFKRAMGLPLHAYLLNCRVVRAKQLLARSDRSVASVAQELRFYSAQHFAKTFKRVIGVTPQEFRRDPKSPLSASERACRPTCRA